MNPFLTPALLLTALLLGACNRLYSISVNEQVLYDPRPGNPVIRFDDPGLQSCVNLALRQDPSVAPENITILSCAGLEIESLEGLSTLRGLEYVDVGDNELEHLDALGRLPRLVSVRAADNPLTDVSALLRAGSLTTVVLTGNRNIPCSQLDALEEQLGNDLQRPAQCVD
ncbi:MAG: hypothetical protein WEB57_10240 [Pseudohongiellaceae bacterium]